MHWVYFETLREWSWRLDILWESGQDHVLELYCMVRKRVDKVEVEVTNELWVVLQNDKYNVHCGCVEASHGCRSLNSWQHVMFDEIEAAAK